VGKCFIKVARIKLSAAIPVLVYLGVDDTGREKERQRLLYKIG
jgi:hypothetical protein